MRDGRRVEEGRGGVGISFTYHNKYILLAVVVKVAHQTWQVSKTSAVREVQIHVHIVDVIPLGILVMRSNSTKSSGKMLLQLNHACLLFSF